MVSFLNQNAFLSGFLSWWIGWSLIPVNCSGSTTSGAEETTERNDIVCSDKPHDPNSASSRKGTENHVRLAAFEKPNWLKMPRHIWGRKLQEYRNHEDIYRIVTQPNVPHCRARCPRIPQKRYTTKMTRDALCSSFPVIHVVDSPAAEINDDPTLASFPCFLYRKASSIPKAGIGVFTSADLPAGIILGPYKGFRELRNGDEERCDDPAETGSHRWILNYDNGTVLTINAGDRQKMHSNWMRYVNTARYEEEQNLFPLPVLGQVYYITYKNIAKGSELLTDYGRDYLRALGYTTTESGPTLMGLAPLKHKLKTSSKP